MNCNNMKKHFNITITGKVQGVAYRYWAEKNANELGIVGFVKNNNDGSVYMEIEGELEVLKKFLDECVAGPRNAEVKDVQFWEGEIAQYKNFEIRV